MDVWLVLGLEHEVPMEAWAYSSFDLANNRAREWVAGHRDMGVRFDAPRGRLVTAETNETWFGDIQLRVIGPISVDGGPTDPRLPPTGGQRSRNECGG